MSIERARDRRGRTLGLVARYPRPDGISRRVASAARDRHLGPLPEQVPTGWHRHVFDHPAAAVSAGRTPDGGPPDATGRHRRQVGRVLDGGPTRRGPAAVVIGALGAVVVLGAGAALILATTSGGPADPPPASTTTRPAAPAATTIELPSPTLTVESVGPTTETKPATVSAGAPAPAVVSTLTPGDPGFGWPSTAFGSESAGG